MGRPIYGIDVERPGMLYATVARSPVHGGTLRSIDDSGAMAVPGVRRVARMSSGAVVLATSTWAAMKGREALRLEWDEGPKAALSTADTWRLLEEALARGGKVARSNGDAAGAIAASARRMDAEYRWPWNAHAALEPLSAVAEVRDGRCEIWAGTQSPNRVQDEAAKLLGVPREAVTVHGDDIRRQTRARHGLAIFGSIAKF